MDEYLDVKALSHYIPRSPGAIRNLVLRKAIPFRKVGGRLMFIKGDIDRWIRLSPGLSLESIEKGDRGNDG